MHLFVQGMEELTKSIFMECIFLHLGWMNLLYQFVEIFWSRISAYDICLVDEMKLEAKLMPSWKPGESL